jgi:integrase/recombinase XerC
VAVLERQMEIAMPQNTKINQGTIIKFPQETHLLTWIEAFLVDRKAQGLTEGTLDFYKDKLALFTDYCDSQLITQITEINPNLIRMYLLYLEDKGHNPGGVHAAYRSLRTFLYWWEEELEPEGWKNPIRRVKPPKLSVSPLEPANMDDLKEMIDRCDGSFYGKRDKAILFSLLDTGARAKEFIAINLDDYNHITGEILIREGKGGKFRSVFLGKKSRRIARAYLRVRQDDKSTMWVLQNGDRLTYWGLRQIIRRRAIQAEVAAPPIHSFRRAFALNMLRAGVDLFSLQKLMGHADLQVLSRYLALTTEDTAKAHKIGSPVDNSSF